MALDTIKYTSDPITDVSKSAVIADDDETIRSILQYKLSAAGFDLTVCHDGEEGREALNDPDADPDVVILDVMMPRLKGTQLLMEPRRRSTAPRTSHTRLPTSRTGDLWRASSPRRCGTNRRTRSGSKRLQTPSARHSPGTRDRDETGPPLGLVLYAYAARVRTLTR